MMKKLVSIVVVIMIATLVLAACGGGAPAASPEPTRAPAENKSAAQPTQPPAEMPAVGKDEPATPEPLELSDVTAGLGELDSYKASFSMTFEGKEDGQPKSGTMAFTEEFVKDPPAKRTVVTGLGATSDGDTGTPAPDQPAGIESIEVGGKMYSKMGDMCTQITADSGPQANTMMDPNSIIGGVRGARRVGNETINGVPAVHYKLDVSGLETLGYLNGDGDVWVAEPGNFVVKYTFQATGKDKFFGSANSEGTIKWEYEVSDVNQPIDIQPPADCGGAAEDIPMLDDAQDQAAMGGMITYSTPSKFEDVAAFYEKEMKASGWQEAEDGGMSTEGMSMKNYTKDGRTVQIIITADSSSDKTSVMIAEEKK